MRHPKLLRGLCPGGPAERAGGAKVLRDRWRHARKTFVIRRVEHSGSATSVPPAAPTLLATRPTDKPIAAGRPVAIHPQQASIDAVAKVPAGGRGPDRPVKRQVVPSRERTTTEAVSRRRQAFGPIGNGGAKVAGEFGQRFAQGREREFDELGRVSGPVASAQRGVVLALAVLDHGLGRHERKNGPSPSRITCCHSRPMRPLPSLKGWMSSIS